MRFIHVNKRLFALAIAALLAAPAARAADRDPAKLIATLKAGAAAEKALACKELAICGTADAVPALAPLLADPELSSWARIALEAIPGPACDEALRAAAGKLQGRLLVGVINSLAVRRDAKAVDFLVAKLKEGDVEIATAAAAALGHIGGSPAAGAVEQALTASAPALRSAAAEGCVLCAEQFAAGGKTADALKLLAAVRKADVPKQRVREAIRDEIVIQGAAGVPLLAEQLRSTDKALFALALGITREMRLPEVTQCLMAELPRAEAARQALIIQALADRGDAVALPAVLELAKSGVGASRLAALRALGRMGSATCVPVLLAAALEADEDVAKCAVGVLADLPGADVDKDLAAQLGQAQGKTRALLVDLAGRRAIVAAVPALVQAAGDADPQVRAAALTALGATIDVADLPKLIQWVVKPQDAGDVDAAQKALAAACQRMADRDAAARQLLKAMVDAPVAVKCRFLEILSTLGGAEAIAAMKAAMQDSDAEIQDTASRLLGAWMDLDAAPLLLDLAKNSTDDKYKIRAMRGYIRLVRQFAMSDADRAKMCRQAMEAAQRTAEKKLVLEIMGRNATPDMLSLALETAKTAELKREAVAVAMLIASKTGKPTPELQKLLGEIGQGMVKIEIIKAEYGAGAKVKDVTTILRKHVHDFPVILLPSPSFNATFGGDPAPGTPKQLRVQYRMDGKQGEAVFKENASIELPRPKA